MKSGVGNKGKVCKKLTILFAILIIFSILSTFSMTVYDETGMEVLKEEDGFSDNDLPLEPHGVRAGEPTWSPLFGSLPSSGSYFGIDFGDVNNDGNLDVIASSSASGVQCWVGDGTGGWTDNSTGLPISGTYTDVGIADLNNDGKLDVVFGHYPAMASGEVWTGNGGVGGEMIWTSQTAPGDWYGVALGDIDNNGTIDIAAATANGVKVWTSNGGAGGSFVWSDSSDSLPASGMYYGIDLGDVNNDGKLDIVAGNSGGGIRVWVGNGESGPSAVWTDITQAPLPMGGGYAQVRFGDANNDGELDIVVASQSLGVRFFKGDGGFSWVEESDGLSTLGTFWGLSFGDVNNDGNLDIVGGNFSIDGVDVWLGDGGEGGEVSWKLSKNGLTTGQAYDVCLGDVNNDGRLDIGVATEGAGVQVWAGNLPDLNITGWISASTNLPFGSGNGSYDVVFGDVNHDGKLDLAYTTNSNKGVKVWLGDGTGVWTEIVDPDVPSTGNYNGVRLNDVNHDGNLDLIAGNNDGNGMFVWLGNGSGGFGPDTGPGGPTSMGGVEVSDINNDCNIDLVSTYYIPGSQPEKKVYAWLGDGNGGWGPDIGPLDVGGFNDITLGDVDHNGTIDLFATMHTMGFRFWLGNGSGGWSLQPQNGLPFTSNPPWIGGLGACFGDVNHDGDLDVATGGYNGDIGLRIYLSDGGNGGEVDWTNSSDGLPITGQYAGVELGDIDNDGNLDILSANNAGTSNGILLTLGNGGQGGSMIWNDALLPDLPSSGNYWGVAFGDVNNDGVLDIAITSANGVEVYITQTRPSYKINLLEGWNLISLPMIQTDTSLDAVLASINGQYKAMQYFDPSDAANPWKHYEVSKPPSLNDLTDLNHTMGIWIYITEPGGTTLTVYGNEFVTGQSIIIRPGWNMVGYPSKSDKPRDVALNNTATDIDWVGYFDASTDRFVILSAGENMEVGRGYWVHSMRTIDIVWNVPL